jgi:hypothetical protein
MVDCRSLAGLAMTTGDLVGNIATTYVREQDISVQCLFSLLGWGGACLQGCLHGCTLPLTSVVGAHLFLCC